MPLRRTVRVALDVPDSAAASLHETVDQYRTAADHVVDAAWPDGESEKYLETRRTVLHERTYEAVRTATDLPAQLVQSARNRAADALAGVVARWDEGQAAGKPSFTSPSVRYDTRSATVREDHATLATVDGRVRVEFRLPTDPAGTPHGRYLFADDWTVVGADLVYDDVADVFRLHVRCEAEPDTAAGRESGDSHERGWDDNARRRDGPEARGDTSTETEQESTGAIDTEHRTVLGVDCGVDNLAVASTGRFWSGRELDHWRQEFERRRSDLQARDTRAAKRAARRVARRAQGYFDHVLHRVSREIVAEAVTHDCGVIAVEDLTGIRERLPGGQRFHAWAFRQLQSYVEYKAAEAGVETVIVDPANTSRRCSRCGHVAVTNRQSQTDFVCGDCGYTVDADYNAAKNIGVRACGALTAPGEAGDEDNKLQSAQMSAAGGVPEGVRLNGGLLTANGTYVPTDRTDPDGQSVKPR